MTYAQPTRNFAAVHMKEAVLRLLAELKAL
jgi:hypothetical protein